MKRFIKKLFFIALALLVCEQRLVPMDYGRPQKRRRTEHTPALLAATDGDTPGTVDETQEADSPFLSYDVWGCIYTFLDQKNRKTIRQVCRETNKGFFQYYKNSDREYAPLRVTTKSIKRTSEYDPDFFLWFHNHNFKKLDIMFEIDPTPPTRDHFIDSCKSLFTRLGNPLAILPDDDRPARSNLQHLALRFHTQNAPPLQIILPRLAQQERFPCLRLLKLNLAETRITNLNTAVLPRNLTTLWLDLTETRITNLETAGLPRNLTTLWLDLTETRITNLETAGLPRNLQELYLYLAETQITNLYTAGLPRNLQELSLYLAETQITNLYTAGLPRNLTILLLSLKGTQITNLDTAGLPRNLTTLLLSLAETQITNLETAGLPRNLQKLHLYLAETQITNLDTAGLPRNLQELYLYLAETQITNLDRTNFPPTLQRLAITRVEIPL